MAKVLSITAKVNDRFIATLIVDGKGVKTHNGYVPKFMPEDHYGDYVELEIDIETGQILNWSKPSYEEVYNQLNGE